MSNKNDIKLLEFILLNENIFSSISKYAKNLVVAPKKLPDAKTLATAIGKNKKEIDELTKELLTKFESDYLDYINKNLSNPKVKQLFEPEYNLKTKIKTAPM